jgi:hypothetical protein
LGEVKTSGGFSLQTPLRGFSLPAALVGREGEGRKGKEKEAVQSFKALRCCGRIVALVDLFSMCG